MILPNQSKPIKRKRSYSIGSIKMTQLHPSDDGDEMDDEGAEEEDQDEDVEDTDEGTDESMAEESSEE